MKKSLPLLLAFVAGTAVLLVFQTMSKFLGEWRTIQVLQTTDRKHTAELNRLYGYIDVNYKITVDGTKVYWSPDFAPRKDCAFREWITWDEKQKNIVFIAANRILFAYNLDSQAPVPQTELSSLVIPFTPLQELGFEGEFKGKVLTMPSSESSETLDR